VKPTRSQRGEELPRGVRYLLVAAGLVCVGLGAVGVFVPLLPTTPFLLLAAACFARSSDRFYHWLMTHRWLGSYIRNYVERRATTLATKAASIAMLWCFLIAAGVFFTGSWVVRSLLMVVAVGVTMHLASLTTVTSGSGGAASEDDDRQGARPRDRQHRGALWRRPGMS
jgi:uncharacterized membrane protein YbaN (DUF454 family)